MAHLILELERSVGIGPLHFGMSILQAASVMEQWGEVKITPPGAPTTRTRVNARLAGPARDIYAKFEDSKMVNT